MHWRRNNTKFANMVLPADFQPNDLMQHLLLHSYLARLNR